MASTSSNSASTNEGKKLKLKLKPEKFPTYQSHLSSFGSSSTSAPHYNYKYDVFISFRGEDTRNSFAAHLHRDLIGNGIFVFKDDEELHRGKEISPGLLHAIEDSRLSIVIFSNNYATSSWCLDELVHILECSRKPGKSIIPIFYDVDPTDVRHQSGTYAPAFAELENKYPAEKVKKWRFVYNYTCGGVGDKAASKLRLASGLNSLMEKLKNNNCCKLLLLYTRIAISQL